jgi:alpha-methylacyl-CoA racemase
MLLAFGIACGLFEARRSGKGQVVDAAMIEGASVLATMFWGMLAARRWSEARGENVLDSGAPWYDTYETRDGRFVAIGAIEPKVYAELLERLGLARETLPAQHDRAGWPELRRHFAAVFRSRTRDEWCAVFEGSDACFAPVLTFAEARRHPHNVARKGYITVGEVAQPAPAPRFSRTPGAVERAAPERGAHGRDALADWDSPRRGRATRVARPRFPRLDQAAFFAQRSSSSQPPMRVPLTKICGTVCAFAIAPTIRLRTLWSRGTST